jgi:YHS domain-containing protein
VTKTTILLLAAMAIAIFLATPIFAEKENPAQSEPARIEFKEQTNCPVMGGPINKEYYTDIQGQRVYHCCPACAEKLEADPDKYFKEAAEQGVLFENIQTACPVTGKEISQEVSIYHEGRTVFFCCEGCISTFKDDPGKYLSILDKPIDVENAPEKTDEKMPDMNMEHHN